MRNNLLLGSLVLGLGTLTASQADAAFIFVDTFSDAAAGDGQCSLREAVQAANTDAAVDSCPAGGGADTIVLFSPGDFDLSQGSISVTSDLQTLLPADDVYRLVAAENDRHLIVSGAIVTLNGLTFSGGTAPLPSQTRGGAILHTGGALTLDGCTLTDNSADRGGAVYSSGSGSLTITNSVLRGNAASLVGGALETGVPTSIADSTIAENSSGDTASGIYATNDLSLFQTTISGNQHTGGGPGGAIFMINTNLTISGSAFVNNGPADEALYVNSSTVVVDRTVFSGHVRNCEGGGANIQSLGYNLVDLNDPCAAVFDDPTDMVGVPAGLGPIADNGGPAPTHLPLAGSHLIDGAECLGGEALLDARGAARSAGARCDIGPVELEGFGLVSQALLLDPGERGCPDGGFLIVQGEDDGAGNAFAYDLILQPDEIERSQAFCTPVDGTSCTVEDNGDGTSTISCEDGTEVVISDGADGTDGTDGTNGTDGQDGSSCSAVDNGDGTYTISCEDGTEVVVTDGLDGQDGAEGSAGADGADGLDGADGEAGLDGTDGEDGADGLDGLNGLDGDGCTVVDNNDGTWTLTCDDGTTATIRDGADGSGASAGSGGSGGGCTVAELGDGTATITCDDGTSANFGTVVTDGDDSGCSATDGTPTKSALPVLAAVALLIGARRRKH